MTEPLPTVPPQPLTCADAPAPSTSSMWRDLISAYAASATKIGSWVVVSAGLFRHDMGDYAVFALVRATIGLLNYTSLGLAPAMIQQLAQALARIRSQPPQQVIPLSDDQTRVLDYAGPPPPLPTRQAAAAIYSNACLAALLTAIVGIGLTIAYSHSFALLHRVPFRMTEQIGQIVMAMGLGTVLRLVSDVHGAVLQSHQQIARDNAILSLADLAWVALCVTPFSFTAGGAAYAYLASSGLLLAARWRAARDCMSILPEARYINWRSLRELLAFGVLVSCAQLADFLYAPTDFILINRFLGPLEVAVYAPAVQIDAAMLVPVAGLAAVLLPRGAAAHAQQQYATLRMYYVRGTLASAAILAIAALAVWGASPWIFKLWLGDSMPATRAILPLVLTHTVVGGSSAVGRSILLGMGKIKPFTVSVLVAGAGNVMLSYVFVRYTDLGLKGIVLGTIIGVTARCAIWTPWYVLRVLPRT